MWSPTQSVWGNPIILGQFHGNGITIQRNFALIFASCGFIIRHN